MSDKTPIKTIEELAQFVLAFWKANLSERGVKLEDFVQRLSNEIQTQNISLISILNNLPWDDE